MSIDEKNEVERSLGGLVPKPEPAGLRKRVLNSALEARKNVALTPRMRAVALVWAGLALVAVMGDGVVSRWQSGRIAALLGRPGVSAPAEDEARLLWAEFGADLGDLDRFRREGILLSRLGSRDDSRHALSEARNRLKGITDYEDPEDHY